MRSALILLAFLAFVLPANRVLEAQEETILAGGPAPEAEPAATRPWKVCDVTVATLLNTDRGSEVVAREERLLFHGQQFDLEQEISVTAPGKMARVRVHTRVRAVLARDPGVQYHVTTDGSLSSVIGFEAPDAGQDQFRNTWLDIENTTSQIVEAFSSRSLGARVLLVFTVRPRLGNTLDAGSAVSVGELRSFRVEAKLRELKDTRVLASGVLTASPAHQAELSFGSLGGAAQSTRDPAQRFGRGIVIADVTPVGDSGFGAGHTVETRKGGVPFEREHAVPVDRQFQHDHVVTFDDEDAPRHVTIERKQKHLSQAKREEMKRQQAIAEVRALAIAAAKRLPGAEAAPPGLERENLIVRIELLVDGGDIVQVDVGIAGQVRLPSEKAITPIDVHAVVEIEVGSSVEIALMELLRGGHPEYDYVIELTPLP